MSERSSDEYNEQTGEITSINIEKENSLTPRETIIRAIINDPKNAKLYSSSYAEILAAEDPETLKIIKDSRLRNQGTWVGTGLSFLFTASASLGIIYGSPIAVSVALFSIGATCAGATFAVITGGRVSTSDFSKIQKENLNRLRGQ